MKEQTEFTLTGQELEQYHAHGYLGPFRRSRRDEAVSQLERIERDVFTRDGPLPGHNTFMRHMDSRLVYDLCVHPTVTDRITSLIGPDLMLWNTSFWDKPAGGPEVPWHQDIFYWPSDPPTNITAWLALTDATKDNACLRVIPGSHKKIIPHVQASEKMLFASGADPEQVDDSQAIDIEMQPGEFILFNDRLLHGSPANESEQRRLGYVARFTMPFVKLYGDQIPLFEGHRAIMACGEDRFGFNQFAPPPEQSSPL